MSKWIPWRFLIKRLAKYHGFLDPLALYARLQTLAQPSEVAEPVELLRAGAVFHARGLINSRVLQHNMDWVWPYWVERQFDPADVSFLPRAFSLTHVNLTHRNWTAVGLPGRDELPIVDPRGLLTPFWDSWSIDAWILDQNGTILCPSRVQSAEQTQCLEESLSVITKTCAASMKLETSVSMVATATGDQCRLKVAGYAPEGGFLIVSLRPYNPEGVSFVDYIELTENRKEWLINGKDKVVFNEQVQQHHTSHYTDADVYVHLKDRSESNHTRCNVGLATAAAMFHLLPDRSRSIQVDIPISSDQAARHSEWAVALSGQARLNVPDKRYVELFDASVQTLVLCTPGDAFAGPYTYKRYWYRDTVFIAHGLLSAGLVDRASMLVNEFPARQSRNGYFHSQEGEWDSNGEVLWLVDRLRQLSGNNLTESTLESVNKGAQWLIKKRLPDYGGQAHEGLLPAGFSAEHLGPNDHYYWDNFWAQAGLEAAARIAEDAGKREQSVEYLTAASSYRSAIHRSLDKMARLPGMPAIPAAPTRRLDAGAIGSVAVSYPLQLCEADDEFLHGTVEFLLENCFHQDGFFQDMIHSGVNAYLTMHVAQVLLRAGDPRSSRLIRAVVNLASPTGHWPEAVHPGTGGGCMGDGHHAWAAAEWAAMMRNCFVREERDALVLASGLLPEWLEINEEMSFGPVPTPFGSITVSVIPQCNSVGGLNDATSTNLEKASSSGSEPSDSYQVNWQADWFAQSPEILVQLPGFETVTVTAGSEIKSISCKRVAR